MFKHVTTCFPQLNNDVSLLLNGRPHLSPFPMVFAPDAPPLWRIPYFWEDDIAAMTPSWSWSTSAASFAPGLKVFDFHPIHVALNMANMGAYENLRRVASIPGATPDQVSRLANKGHGAGTFLESLLASLKEPALTIGAIGEKARRAICA